MDVIQPHQNENSASPKKLLYAVIVLLAFLLILQTAGFLFYLHRKEQTERLSPAPSSFSEGSRGSRQSLPPPFPAPRSHAQVNPAGWMSQDPFFEDALTSLGRLHERMSRVFDTPDSFFSAAAMMPSVSVDFEDQGDAYILKSDLPGLEKDEINISVNGNLLTLQGIKKSEASTEDHTGGFYTQERSYGSFSRTLPLPGPVDETKISATYKEGVLTVTLPKLQEAKTSSKIPVQ